MHEKFAHETVPFSEEFIQQIKDRVKAAMKETPKPWVAAFDADGTLWHFDMGEVFFRYQLDHCNLKGLPANAWERYWEMKKTNPPWDCVWLAQINKGVPLRTVEGWSEESFKKLDWFPYCESQKKLMKELRSLGVEIYIVTASIKWAVVPAARTFGVDADHVIGIETKVENGIVTDIPVEPIIHGPGKAEAMMKLTSGHGPVFAAGNSMLDQALLESAKVSLTINSHPPEMAGYTTESRLAALGRQKGWIHHQFYK